MIQLKHTIFFLVFLPLFSGAQLLQQKVVATGAESRAWILNDLISSGGSGIRVAGKPQTVPCQYGKALQFDGLADGVFLDSMLLEGLNQFTIEMIICPYGGGNFEQRFFHCGEVRGDRVLLELRSTRSGWYLDAFIKSGDQQKTLIEPTFLHPPDRWTHIAFVVDHEKQLTYVNGQKELESRIEVLPLHGGKTSIGVRQNELSWFKGAIYQIKITRAALRADQFLKY
jgi:hypothetical protein